MILQHLGFLLEILDENFELLETKKTKTKQKSKIINCQTFHQTQFKLLMYFRHFFFLFVYVFALQ